jgi:hypothetical protein
MVYTERLTPVLFLKENVDSPNERE